VSSDERRQLFEPLAFDGQGIGVVVSTARDVERQLGGRRVPGIGALLAQHGEDVAEHAAEGIVAHGYDFKVRRPGS